MPMVSVSACSRVLLSAKRAASEGGVLPSAADEPAVQQICQNSNVSQGQSQSMMSPQQQPGSKLLTLIKTVKIRSKVSKPSNMVEIHV